MDRAGVARRRVGETVPFRRTAACAQVCRADRAEHAGKTRIPALLLLMMAPAVTFHMTSNRYSRAADVTGRARSGPFSLMTYQEVRPYAKAIRHRSN